jgi:hypothetical protein
MKAAMKIMPLIKSGPETLFSILFVCPMSVPNPSVSQKASVSK